jgi:hypothetical protein
MKHRTNIRILQKMFRQGSSTLPGFWLYVR